jgi:hypothetical protein
VNDEERKAVIDKWHRDGTYLVRLWDALPAHVVIRVLDVTEQHVIDIYNNTIREKAVA